MDKIIKINGKDYAVGGTVRAMLIWEQATDRPFAIRLNGDTLLYYYCLLMAGDPELELTFRDFIDAIEREQEVVTRFAALLSEAEKAKSIFDKKTPKRGKKKA